MDYVHFMFCIKELFHLLLKAEIAKATNSTVGHFKTHDKNLEIFGFEAGVELFIMFHKINLLQLAIILCFTQSFLSSHIVGTY